MGNYSIQVESLIKTKTIIFFIVILLSSQSSAEVGRLYFNQFLGHVHKSADKDSSSLTIVQCSHSVKILKHEKSLSDDWLYVQVGEDKGFIQKDYLSSKKPICLQEKYPKFYLELGLDLTDMYFWGKLNDHFVKGTSKIK